MTHDIFISVVRLLRVKRPAARYKATLMIRLFGMLVVVAAGEAELMLQAPRVVVLDMVVVTALSVKPQPAEFAFLALVVVVVVFII